MKRCRCSTGQLLFVTLVGIAALLAHLVDGYAWCQEYWNWDGKRHSSTDGKRWPANDGVVITYINGIFHSIPEWKSITQQLQAIFGHEVRPFYNPSSGWWITDASKAGYHLLRNPANDSIAQALGEHLRQAVEDAGRGRVLHIAHSGGALITYLAAQHHLTKRQRDKIDVLTFGGARSITRKYFSGRVVNYYARNDPLVKLDRRAAELMKLTSNTKFEEINEKHNTTFVFLEGRARQFVLDHSLEGPTYQHALRKEARAFRRAHFGPLSPLSWEYEYSVLRLARKKVAQLSGLHDFFSTEGFGRRSLRKSVANLTGLHGFFSGKLAGSKGVEVSVVESSSDGEGVVVAAAEGGGGVFSGAMRWWSWGGRTASSTTGTGGDGSAAGAAAPPDAVPEDGPAGGDRFFLGFRWSRRGEQREEEPEGGASDPPLSATAEAGGESSGSPTPPQDSRWARVRGALRFGRGQEGPTVVAGGTVSDSAAEDSYGDSSDDGENTGVVEQAPSAPAVESDSRPWLSVGWTPWGGRAKQQEDGGGDGVSSEAAGEGGDEVEESQPGMAPVVNRGGVVSGAEADAEGAEGSTAEGKGRGDGDDDGDGDGADGSPVEVASIAAAAAGDAAVPPPRGELSYLRRWWPASFSSSSSSSSVMRGATGSADGDDVRPDPEENDKEGEAERVGTGGDRLGDGGTEGAAGEPEEEEGEVESSAAKESEGQPKEDTAGVSGKEQAQSLSLLRRWWPASKQPTSPAPAKEEEEQEEEEAIDGVNVSEVSVTGAGDGDTANKGLESGDLKELPQSPEVRLPKLPSVQQQQQEEEEDKEHEEHEEHEEEGSTGTATTGAEEVPTPPVPATSFAQRFWEIFSNKPVEETPPGELPGEPASVSKDSDGGGDAVAGVRESVKERAVAAVVASAELGGTDFDQGSESLVGEGAEADDSLRPVDDGVSPLPLATDAAEGDGGSDEPEEDEDSGDGCESGYGGVGGGGEGVREGGELGGEDAGARREKKERERGGRGDFEAEGEGERGETETEEDGGARRGQAERKDRVKDLDGEGNKKGFESADLNSTVEPVVGTREDGLLSASASDEALQ